MSQLESQWAEEFSGSLVDFMQEQGLTMEPMMPIYEENVVAFSNKNGIRVTVSIADEREPEDTEPARDDVYTVDSIQAGGESETEHD